MKITIIGAGNLATCLGKALKASRYEVVQVFSRTEQSAKVLATMLEAQPITHIEWVNDGADVYIFAVKDSVLPILVEELGKKYPKKIFLHTAGSMALSIFPAVLAHCGVFYPLQTFSKTAEVDFREIPIFIEGRDEKAMQAMMEIGQSISDNVRTITSADRKYIHLAAVWSCNFVNHCYNRAAKVLAERNLPFDVLYPLIDETRRKVHHIHPQKAQTGPAVRYDANVIAMQKELMDTDEMGQELYELLSKDIHRFAEAHL